MKMLPVSVNFRRDECERTLVSGKFVRAAKAQKGWAAAPLQDRTKCLHDFAR
jgi:hypothetical protein